MIRHITLASKLTIVAVYMLIVCWIIPDAVAKSLEKGIYTE